MTQQLLLVHGLFFVEAPLSHSDTPHSVGFLWMSDQLYAEPSKFKTHNPHKRRIPMLPGGIRTRNLDKCTATETRLRSRGHWGQTENKQQEDGGLSTCSHRPRNSSDWVKSTKATVCGGSQATGCKLTKL